MASATQGEMKVANMIVKAGWGGSGQEDKWFSIYREVHYCQMSRAFHLQKAPFILSHVFEQLTGNI